MKGRSSNLTKMHAELLDAARSGSKVTYGQLMKNYSLSRGAALTKAIGEVDHLEYAKGAPGFAAIIVRKDTGFPGGGYFFGEGLPPGLSREASRRSDPRLSALERNHIVNEQKRVWSYYRGRP